MEFTARSGEGDPVIGKITFDSRDIDRGDLFVAIRGTEADGHHFMEAALKSGAAAVVCEAPGDLSDTTLPLLVVSDSRRALARMAATFYAHPSEELSLVGVTGTNGKTTIATLLQIQQNLQS